MFPEVSKQAHVLAGIKVKQTDKSLSLESGSDSSNLDSDHEGFGNGNNGNCQSNGDCNSQDGSNVDSDAQAEKDVGRGNEGDDDNSHNGQNRMNDDVEDDNYKMSDAHSDHGNPSESELQEPPKISEISDWVKSLEGDE